MMNQHIEISQFNREEFRKSLGLVLVFVGMQFNTAIKNVVIGMDFSVVIMLFSALLLLDTRSFFRVRMSKSTCFLLSMQLMLFLISVISNRSTTQLITFHLYLVALILALSTNKDYVQFLYFGKILFWVSGFIAILVLFQATNGFTRLNLTFNDTGKLWLSQGGDPITMSRALEFNLIACLFYKDKNRIEKIAAWIFVIADIIGVFSFSNRSVTVCAIAVFCIWYVKCFNRKVNIKKMAITILIIILTVYLGSKISYFKDKVEGIYTSIKNGIGTLLNISVISIDSSAKTRLTILDTMKEQFDKDFIKNFFLGMGYNYTYVDSPIYQIYFDFGCFGWLIYVYFLLFIPIKTIIKQLRNNVIYNGAWLFVVYGSIQVIADQMLTGLPYYYYLWTPTIFFLFSINNYKPKQLNRICKES